MSSLARVYAETESCLIGFDNFIAKHAKDIESVEMKRQTIRMRNGDRVYFIVMRLPADIQKVSGMEFSSITVQETVKDEHVQYLRARLRGYNCEPDITYMEV